MTLFFELSSTNREPIQNSDCVAQPVVVHYRDVAPLGMCLATCKVLLRDWTKVAPKYLLDEERLANVDHFCYLSSRVTKDVSSHMSKAQAAYTGLKPLWPRPDASLNLKSRKVRSVLLCGSETRNLGADDTRGF